MNLHADCCIKEQDQSNEKKRLEALCIKRRKELFSTNFSNIWTGLRIRPDNDEAGRNWMTYFCLKRRRQNFPSDIMIIINEYLNWTPAGCWRINPLNKCITCSNRYINLINGLPVCSWQCYEMELRTRLEKGYKSYVRMLDGFEIPIKSSLLMHILNTHATVFNYDLYIYYPNFRLKYNNQSEI